MWQGCERRGSPIRTAGADALTRAEAAGRDETSQGAGAPSTAPPTGGSALRGCAVTRSPLAETCAFAQQREPKVRCCLRVISTVGHARFRPDACAPSAGAGRLLSCPGRRGSRHSFGERLSRKSSWLDPMWLVRCEASVTGVGRRDRAGALSGPRGGEVVAVELGEVVGHHQ